jgi:1-acyl-sn-glycerol-3-phosphate acyltransferase
VSAPRPGPTQVGGSGARRRLRTVPGVFLALVLLVVTAPITFPVAAVVDLVTGRRRWPTPRLLAMAIAALGIDAVGLVALGGMWIVSGGGRFMQARYVQRAHFALQHWWTGALMDAAEVTLGLRMIVEDDEPARTGNAIVIGRHTSIGDAAIPAVLLGNRHRFDVRYVLKHDLQWDPCIDVVGHRLPHHFVDRGGDRATEADAIRRIATGLDERSVAVIFPEGTFFTEARHERAVRRLEGGSRPELAARAARLHHLLPPRTAGTLALLDGAPDADVVVLGHIGFEQFNSLRAIRRSVPFREPVRIWLRRIQRADVPVDTDARVDWLYQVWERLDTEIAERTEGEHVG